MHLIQPNNTLGAEIELAGAATIVRRRNGVVLTETQELIDVRPVRAPERHSDPHIGAMVNELARLKADITLTNPIGLYIAGLSVAGWQTPDNSDPLSYWTITRGTKEKALRAVYEVPAVQGLPRRRHQDQREGDRVRRADCRLHPHQADRHGHAHRPEHRRALRHVRDLGRRRRGRCRRSSASKTS